MARKNNPKQTVESILAVSARLFLEKGYDRTSMQGIVDALGMSKGAIFHHFRSKEEILDAVLNRHFESAERKLLEWLGEMREREPGLSAREKIARLFEKTIKSAETSPLILMFIEFQSPRMTMASLRDGMERTAPMIAGLMREGIEDGSISAESPGECAEVLLLLYNVWCDPVALRCGEEALRRRLEFVRRAMRLLGADVVTCDFIEAYLEFTKRLRGGAGLEAR